MSNLGNKSPAVIIFSVYQHNGILADITAHNEVMEHLYRNKFQYKELTGCYNGIREKSILLVNNFDHIEPFVVEMCYRYNQDSYLTANELRETALIYTNGQVEKFSGKLQEVTKEKAVKLGNYSTDGSTYWAVV